MINNPLFIKVADRLAKTGLLKVYRQTTLKRFIESRNSEPRDLSYFFGPFSSVGAALKRSYEEQYGSYGVGVEPYLCWFFQPEPVVVLKQAVDEVCPWWLRCATPNYVNFVLVEKIGLAKAGTLLDIFLKPSLQQTLRQLGGLTYVFSLHDVDLGYGKKTYLFGLTEGPERKFLSCVNLEELIEVKDEEELFVCWKVAKDLIRSLPTVFYELIIWNLPFDLKNRMLEAWGKGSS